MSKLSQKMKNSSNFEISLFKKYEKFILFAAKIQTDTKQHYNCFSRFKRTSKGNPSREWRQSQSARAENYSKRICEICYFFVYSIIEKQREISFVFNQLIFRLSKVEICAISCCFVVFPSFSLFFPTFRLLFKLFFRKNVEEKSIRRSR